MTEDSDQEEYLTDMVEVICPDCGEEQKQPDELDVKWQCSKCGFVAENGMESGGVSLCGRR